MKFKLLIMCAVIFSACTQNPEEKKETEKPVEKKITPYTTNELAKFLPKEIAGYKPKKPATGLDIKAKNGSFAFTTQSYYKANDSIYVELHDYKNAPMLYENYAYTWWLSKNEVNTPEMVSAYLSYGESIDAWEVFEKANKRTTIYVGAYMRYYLIFECFGKNNTGFIKEAANTFDYNQLKW